MCWARAMPSCRASCAAGSRASRLRPARPGPMPAAPSPCRGFCARRKSRPGTELQYFLKHGSPQRALAQGRGDQSCPLGDDAAARRPASCSRFAIDHRKQLEDDGRQARRAARAHRRLQAPGGRGDGASVAQGKPGFGMLLDETYGREAMFDAAKHDFWIGRPVEVPGSRPLRFEFTQDVGARLVEWPVTHTIKCLAFYHPDDDAALKQRAGAETAHALRSGAQRRPRTADRDHRRQAWRARRRHGRARARRALCARHQARLVEARAAGVGRGLGEHRRTSSRATIPIAAASCCSASMRPRTSWRGPSPRPRPCRRSRALPSAARSSAMWRKPGSPGRSTTKRRSPTWRSASPISSGYGIRRATKDPRWGGAS